MPLVIWPQGRTHTPISIHMKVIPGTCRPAAYKPGLKFCIHVRYSSKVTSHSSLVTYSHSTQALLERSSLDPESIDTYAESWSTIDLPRKLLWNKVIQPVINPCITINTCYLAYLCRLKPIKHWAKFCPASCSPLLQSCDLLFIWIIFILVSRAKQENLSWSNVSFILRELQLLVRSHAFCRVSSEIKKYNFEMKKSLRRTILVHAIALHVESFSWAAVFTEYELLMQISKSTRHALDLHSKMSSKCDVTLELYHSPSFYCYKINFNRAR